MFELLFKYPRTVFTKGDFVLLAPWPHWLLGAAVLAAAAGLLWHLNRNRGLMSGLRPAAIWLLQTAMIALLLLMLWHPAISVATLRPQQNVVSLLIDDSRSMSLKEGGSTRTAQVTEGLNAGVLEALKKKFQVRLYRFGKDLERIDKPETVKGAAEATRLGDAIEQALADSATLPLGALVVLTDGADNSGGIGRETVARIRQRRIPVHTVGVGREKISPDVELVDVTAPARTLADSRLSTQVTFVQRGYTQRRAKLTVRDAGKVLASRDITLKAEGMPQTESLQFQAAGTGAKAYQFSVEPLENEENTKNNSLLRLVNVEAAKPRILYIEGEPRWEYKFIRRAVEDDRSLQVVTLLRTTQNKNYRQGTIDAKELEDGFPTKAEDLFKYAGLIIGNVEATYFTPQQQEIIREFANRRGGGVLFLGGRTTLSDGGYPASPLAEMLPVRLAPGKGTFHRDKATFELTPAGRDNLVTRLDDTPEGNADRWKRMPQVADYQDVGEAKPGAVVLGELHAPGKRATPGLVLQSYGRGRTALFATSGSWRWQMLQHHTDRTHEMFWQQLLRWLAAESPGRVISSTPHPVLADETKVSLRAEVRDKEYKPMSSVRVTANIVGPEASGGSIEMSPDPLEEGVYVAEWTATRPGSYVAEVLVKRDQEEVGRDVLMFRREDGVAENFRQSQNRELLEKLAEQTGGKYYKIDELKTLPDQISYSEAGISTRETKDLWDMPALFLAALALRSTEWLLRRKWGVI